MNIHEHQAKEILAANGAPVANGLVAFSGDEARTAASQIPGPPWVVKAQIHAGGRGKGHFLESDAGEGGGVRIAESKEDVTEFAKQMLGSTLVTKQTGPAGRIVRRVYIEASCDIARECYLAILVDRSTQRIVFIASTEGGMDIEKVAAETPEKVHSIHLDPVTGVKPFHKRRIAQALALEGSTAKQCGTIIDALYRTFLEKDCSLIEINPLTVTGDKELVCLDCKLGLDTNALFRQPEARALRDESEEDPHEIEASRYGLNYIALNGSIGCMVNGAGLAMATMDIIQLHGGTCANFLDVGGGANREQITAAFKIVLSNKNVRGILVNIFGGILRCDIIADGILAAAKEVNLNVPLVVRLEGTNVELGRATLENSSLPIIAAENLNDAARKIVAAVDEKD